MLLFESASKAGRRHLPSGHKDIVEVHLWTKLPILHLTLLVSVQRFKNFRKIFKGLGFGAAGERRELVLPPRGWPGGVAGGLGPPSLVPVQARWRQRIFPVQDPHRAQRHLVP